MESTNNRFNQGKENLSRKKETVEKFNNRTGKNEYYCNVQEILDMIKRSNLSRV